MSTPATWWAASLWGRPTITAVPGVTEVTAHFITRPDRAGKPRRVARVTRYETLHPTFAEARDALLAHTARKMDNARRALNEATRDNLEVFALTEPTP